MKTKIHNIALAALCVAAVCLSPFAAQTAEEDLRKEAEQSRANFLKADPGLQKFFDESAGSAIFPSVGKGGLIVGAARGKGIVYEKSKVVGEAIMTQASIGAQAGGQTFSEVIFFETPEALKDFKGGKFEMSAEVSAVAAAEGASKAAKYKNGVAVFTLPHKGLMVQASVGGQKFKFIPAE
jgi:lipid-binding SYLF domain-containing protein